jgi:hypothetical protein
MVVMLNLKHGGRAPTVALQQAQGDRPPYLKKEKEINYYERTKQKRYLSRP